MPNDYSSITELPGSRATSEQLSRLYHRYHTAETYGRAKRVLEVGCGPGLGLGYLSASANMVVGGDYTENVIRIAQDHYHGRVPLIRLDAQHLPFRDRAFDLVVMFEAIYYLACPEEFFAESRRVLADRGTLLISTVNKDWSEFTPSLLSTRYLSVPELRNLLTQQGFDSPEVFAAFPASAASLRQKAVSFIRRSAVALNVVPKTLGGREHLKRLFYGSLRPIQPEVEDGMSDIPSMVPLAVDRRDSRHKIIYVVARTQ